MNGKFPAVFTDKGQDEFNLEYGLKPGTETNKHTAKTQATSRIIKARDSCVPNAK